MAFHSISFRFMLPTRSEGKIARILRKESFSYVNYSVVSIRSTVQCRSHLLRLFLASLNMQQSSHSASTNRKLMPMSKCAAINTRSP